MTADDRYPDDPHGVLDDGTGPEQGDDALDDERPRGRRLAPREPVQVARASRTDEPIRFSTGEERDKTGDHRAFVLTGADDEPLTDTLHGYRPKQWMLIKMAQAEGQDQVDLFLDEVMDGDSADYLRDRFDDPKDDLDVDHLAPAIEGLIGLWYGRPTGRPSGSSRRSGNPRSGRRSTVRRR